MNRNSWITPGIITSHKHKKELKNNNIPAVKSYCRDYSNILSMVIKKTKRIEHDKLILNPYNELKTIWVIINNQEKKKKRGEITLQVEGKKITDQQIIAKTFNEYFVAPAEDIKRQSKNNFIIRNNGNNSTDNHTHFMEQAFSKPYPDMKCKCTMTKEIEQIIKSLETKNPYGYDEIFTKILKISSLFISSPLN
jgi:hypothetical protein